MSDPSSPDAPPTITLARSLGIVALAYLAALVVAALVARVMPAGSHPLVTIACADLAATVVVFAFSVWCNNSSVYDPYWSLAPIVIALYLARGATAAVPLRQTLVIALVVAWGVRLTYNWLTGWTGLAHEDWRYVDIRAKTGALYWPASFGAIHLLPTVMVYLGCFGLVPALLAGDRPVGALDLVACVVTAGAIVIETVADAQLRRFRRSNPPPGAIMNEGLWAYSRHPNYFGEIAFWWGLGLFGLAATPAARWVLAGPLAITLLFVFASIPLIDKRSLARRPGYAAHMKRVSRLIPWFPRREG